MTTPTKPSKGDKINRLKAILATMDVPEARTVPFAQNWRWLQRNLCIQNAGHTNYLEAKALLVELLTQAD